MVPAADVVVGEVECAEEAETEAADPELREAAAGTAELLELPYVTEHLLVQQQQRVPAQIQFCTG